jgi:hypothetical protein
MRRRSILLTAGLVVSAAGLVGGAVGTALKQEPEFYADAPEPAFSETTERASALVTRVQDLKNDIRSKPAWGATFRADDLNCFFRETMADGSGLTALLPPGCSAPRLSIDGDRIRLGARYGCGFWSTVVWVELKAWLVTDDVNVIALEICGLQAGGLPIASQSLLDSISEAAHDSNVDVTWYRHEGNPVGLFRFYANQLAPATQIQSFRVADGTVTVAGRTRLETAAGPVLAADERR